MAKLSTRKPTEIEQLEITGPSLEHMDPSIQHFIQKIDAGIQQAKEAGIEFPFDRTVKVPLVWFMWLANSHEYMLERYHLLKGPANGTTEQPN